ncbi:pyridoxamine 5'-phosphate oxidase family protein [Streptomyces caelestis]|uniref:pyridoxamine 5'-phosphate oxidase family protein n=1 Tax=Streptomyces caelestis TaxID=36816 RepID=UPI00344CF742
MRAHLGDHLVIGSPATGSARRDGEIVGLHHQDGTPPYDVRWSDTHEVSLVFPGPDARVRPPGHGPDPGDIGRRVAAERERRGLSREETARRARMSPDYLAYLEEHPGDPSQATLVRLAGALDTSVRALRGGGADLPPGRGAALLHPELHDLAPQECRALLSTHGVGRVAVTTPEGPAVVPVNYEVVDDAIVFRTAPGSAPAAAVGSEVAFEVDHLDEAMSRGWSVLAVGPAREVTAPDEARRLAEGAHTLPWAGGERELWVSIRPARLTGRRITPAGR